MINTVLLEGSLSKEKLERALAEIRDFVKYSESPLADAPVLVLVISSNEGDALAAVSFVESILTIPRIEVDIKIYQAISTAAFIVLGLSELQPIVEMRKEAVLGIHRGEIRLSPSQVSPDGKIDQSLVEAFESYDDILVEAIKKTKIHGTSNMDTLYATDWLRLSAERCLELGIAQRLF